MEKVLAAWLIASPSWPGLPAITLPTVEAQMAGTSPGQASQFLPVRLPNELA
jgi:hypothetical protein